MPLTSEVLDKCSELITTALGLVAALAWNTSIQNLFDTAFGGSGRKLPGQFLYATLITIVVIFAAISVTRAAERAKKAEEEPSRGLFGRALGSNSNNHWSLKPRHEGLLLEILRGDLVHPVLELVHDLVLGGVFYRLLEDDAGLLNYLVGGEDLGPRADGEGYGVGRPGVDLDRLALYLEPYGGEEGRVLELGHRDPLHRAAELVDEAQGEVVRQGPDELLVLELEQDRAGLRLADPDRQIAVLVFDLEDNYRAGGKEVHVHAVDGHLGEAVGAHWLYAPLTPRGRGFSCTGRFYCQPLLCSIRLSVACPCCTLFRRRSSVAPIT